MSLMFRNTNAALEQELAAEDYKAHPVRNRLAILAVALTAVLMVYGGRWPGADDGAFPGCVSGAWRGQQCGLW